MEDYMSYGLTFEGAAYTIDPNNNSRTLVEEFTTTGWLVVTPTIDDTGEAGRHQGLVGEVSNGINPYDFKLTAASYNEDGYMTWASNTALHEFDDPVILIYPRPRLSETPNIDVAEASTWLFFVDPGYEVTTFEIDPNIAASNRWDERVAEADAYDYFRFGDGSTDQHLIGQGSVTLFITHDQNEISGYAVLYGDVDYYGDDVAGRPHSLWEASFTGSLSGIF
jgi:hypothetical protein